jgi:CheY-like chemotaxis protein
MAQQLRRQGCIVDVASHGLEALAFLKSTVYATNPVPDPARPPTTSPPSLSIILLDLEMPIMVRPYIPPLRPPVIH